MNTTPLPLVALLACVASGCSNSQHADVTRSDARRSDAARSIALADAPVAARRAAPRPASIGQKIAAAARRQVGTSYSPDYFDLQYPGGDPPKNVGACTDVIIRALRPVGFDLQKLMHEDMKRNFSRYRRKWGLRRTDTNIDHRRVPNQKVFFGRFGKSLGRRADASTWGSWQAGDIVQWKLPNELDHTGIVSDRRGASGCPLVIHNLSTCVEEDALGTWRIVGHFRYPKR